MTHSALTKSVQLLEQDLGVVLFNRTTRLVVPTDSGIRLAERAEELLTLADQIGEEVVSGARHIRLTAGPAVIEASLAPALAAFHKMHPRVRVTAETVPPDLAAIRLRQRETDLLLYHSTTVHALPDKRAFQIRQIIDEPYVAVMRKDHPVLHSACSLDDMLRHQWAIPGYDRVFRSAIPPEIEEQYRRAGFPHYRILSLVTCLALVADSDLITLLPQSFALREVRSLDLNIMPMPLTNGARYVVSAITLSNNAPDQILEDLKQAFAAGTALS